MIRMSSDGKYLKKAVNIGVVRLRVNTCRKIKGSAVAAVKDISEEMQAMIRLGMNTRRWVKRNAVMATENVRRKMRITSNSRSRLVSAGGFFH